MIPRLLPIMILLPTLSGCGKERDRCLVEGKASFQGNSLAGFHITLYSEVSGGGSVEIANDGTFKFAGPMEEGEYVVSFAIPFETKGDHRSRLEAIKLPEKYRRSETSDYKVTIVPGKNVLTIEPKPSFEPRTE